MGCHTELFEHAASTIRVAGNQLPDCIASVPREMNKLVSPVCKINVNIRIKYNFILVLIPVIIITVFMSKRTR